LTRLSDIVLQALAVAVVEVVEVNTNGDNYDVFVVE
jgi:hypothetical protein